jgi:hypothetical protein
VCVVLYKKEIKSKKRSGKMSSLEVFPDASSAALGSGGVAAAGGASAANNAAKVESAVDIANKKRIQEVFELFDREGKAIVVKE